MKGYPGTPYRSGSPAGSQSPTYGFAPGSTIGDLVAGAFGQTELGGLRDRPLSQRSNPLDFPRMNAAGAAAARSGLVSAKSAARARAVLLGGAISAVHDWLNGTLQGGSVTINVQGWTQCPTPNDGCPTPRTAITMGSVNQDECSLFGSCSQAGFLGSNGPFTVPVDPAHNKQVELVKHNGFNANDIEWYVNKQWVRAAAPTIYADPMIDPHMIDWPKVDIYKWPLHFPKWELAPYNQMDPAARTKTDDNRLPPDTPKPISYSRPGPGVREVKIASRAFQNAARHFYNTASEVRDFTAALWKALPNQCKTKTDQGRIPAHKRNPLIRMKQQTIPIMIGDIAGCNHKDGPWDKSSLQEGGYWDKAFNNVMENEVQDRFWGAIGKILGKQAAKTKPHGKMPIGFTHGPAL